MIDLVVRRLIFASVLMMGFAPAAMALPSGPEVAKLLISVCVPLAEGDEPDLSVLSRSNSQGGAVGDLTLHWNDRSCRLVAPIAGASNGDQERLAKVVADWAKGIVPQAEMNGRWGGDRPMFSVTNIENSFGYLGFLVYPGTETSIYFEFVWPADDDEEES